MKSELKEIKELLTAIVRAARLGDYGDAARDLNKCLVLFQGAQQEMARIPKPLLDKFDYSLETIFLMLKNKDWVAVADIVEYELTAIWREISKCVEEREVS